jgi:hypothetical protein
MRLEDIDEIGGIGVCILEYYKAMMKVVSDKVFEFSEEIESFIFAMMSGIFEKNYSEHSIEIHSKERNEKNVKEVLIEKWPSQMKKLHGN